MALLAISGGTALPIAVAHVIEGVRLAEALASLRGFSKAGLEELNEATLTVLCNGENILMQLIQDELIVSNKIGGVPTEIPKPPLQLDIERWQKKLRLPPTADFKDYTLDLRKDTDLDRSIFLHRLQLLGIKWGSKYQVSGKGTFKEQWRLQWDPAFSIDIIDRGKWVVKKVVDELLKKLASPMQQAITGSLNRSIRNRRPRHNEINWHTTILKNLKHYQPEYKTIIPETRIGYGRRRSSLKDIVLCLDQSGSMGTSVVYSGIFGSVMASIPSVKTKMVVFDTAVADLTEELSDPVDLLFGVQLGGGTDIHAALTYCQQIITKPLDTVLVLITDLYEGGSVDGMRKKAVELAAAGVQVIVLLALNNDGAPSYDHGNAQFLANLGIPVFACTPNKFPDLMATALSKQDVIQWAAREDIIIKK